MGLDLRLTGTGEITFAWLHKLSSGSDPNQTHFFYPEVIRKLIPIDSLRINLAEYGGPGSFFDFAVIVTSGRGTPFKPYFISKPEDTEKGSNTHYTRFSIPYTGYTVSCDNHSKVVTVEQHTIMKPLPETIAIRSDILFHGPDRKLPSKLSFFGKAVAAAVAKASHEGCWDSHFSRS